MKTGESPAPPCIIVIGGGSGMHAYFKMCIIPSI